MKATQTTGTEHDLKVWPAYFGDLENGSKPFEIRRDDRPFAVGDVLLLREYLEPGAEAGDRGRYTGRQVRRRVTYVLQGEQARLLGCRAGFLIMGIEPAVRPCYRCEGSGQVANTDDAEPWPVWEQLPPGSDLAVRAGIVRPVPCPECHGEKVRPL